MTQRVPPRSAPVRHPPRHNALSHQEKPRSFPHTSSPMPKPRRSWSPKEQKSLQVPRPCHPASPQHPSPGRLRVTTAGGAPSNGQSKTGETKDVGSGRDRRSRTRRVKKPAAHQTSVHRPAALVAFVPGTAPTGQAWWPPWGTQGRWAAAQREDWPPPPSETRWTLVFFNSIHYCDHLGFLLSLGNKEQKLP